MPQTSPKEPLYLVARRARANKSNMRLALIIAAIALMAGFADALSTDLALATGRVYELNPLIRAFQEWLGPFWIFPKIMMHLLICLMVMWYPNRPTLIAMSLVSTLVLLVSANNFRIYFELIEAI